MRQFFHALPHGRQRAGNEAFLIESRDDDRNLHALHYELRANPGKIRGTPMAKKYKFKAEIHPGDRGGAYVLFPYDVEKEFGTKGRIPVQATLDGIHETTSLITYGSPQHML